VIKTDKVQQRSTATAPYGHQRATMAKQQRLKQSVGTVQPQVTGMVANTPPSLCKTVGFRPQAGAAPRHD
jgi:hypothetical protein